MYGISELGKKRECQVAFEKPTMFGRLYLSRLSFAREISSSAKAVMVTATVFSSRLQSVL